MKIILTSLINVFFVFTSLCYAGSYTVDHVLEQVNKKKLPDYCAHMGVLHYGRTAKGKQFRNTYGPDWDHMHHYCWALLDFQRGLDKQAIGNLDYVLRNSKETFTLRPMVLFKKAQILSINQKYQEAAAAYSELIKIRPDSEPAYLGMANIFLLRGDKQTAKEIAKEGLEHLPDSQRLKEILK